MSTTSRLVRAPVRRIAFSTRLSSISRFVRPISAEPLLNVIHQHTRFWCIEQVIGAELHW